MEETQYHYYSVHWTLGGPTRCRVGNPSMVSVKSYYFRVDAELAKAVLEANDIPAMISADDASGLQPWISQGVRVLVNAEDAPLAGRLLAEPPPLST